MEREEKELVEGTREAVTLLMAAIEARDAYTGNHVKRVARFAGAIGRVLGLDVAEVREVILAGLLHDVGKVWVGDSVLQKDGALDDHEWEEMRRHPQFGWGVLVAAEGEPWRRIAQGLLLHHERPDGRGYPFGLRGNEIPRLARILAVADTFDAMTSDRPYRKSLGAQAAFEEIVRYRGTQFCEKVVDAFVAAFRMGEMGETRERAAEIVSATGGILGKPGRFSTVQPNLGSTGGQGNA